MDKVFYKWTFARIWNVLNLAFGACILSLALTACGDSSDDVAGGSAEEEGIIAIKDKTVSGVSQKGPFVNGSSVQLYELDGKTYAPTGRTFPGKISNDRGEFKIAGINLESQYAFLEASGYYRNEVTGEKSAAPITLNAISDLSKRETVNINLLTHLEYERVMKLVEDGMSIAEAKKQAEQEVFAAFGIEGDFDNSEDLNIFESGEADAALLAISILLQGERSEADLSELLANFAQDIAEDGKWDDEKKKAEIADWASYDDLSGQLELVGQAIKGWSLGDVPDYEKYVRNFWQMNYKLGVCDELREGEIAVDSNENSKNYYKNSKVRYICKHEGDGYGWILENDSRRIPTRASEKSPIDSQSVITPSISANGKGGQTLQLTGTLQLDENFAYDEFREDSWFFQFDSILFVVGSTQMQILSVSDHNLYPTEQIRLGNSIDKIDLDQIDGCGKYRLYIWTYISLDCSDADDAEKCHQTAVQDSMHFIAVQTADFEKECKITELDFTEKETSTFVEECTELFPIDTTLSNELSSSVYTINLDGGSDPQITLSTENTSFYFTAADGIEIWEEGSQETGFPPEGNICAEKIAVYGTRKTEVLLSNGMWLHIKTPGGDYPVFIERKMSDGSGKGQVSFTYYKK